MLQKSKLLLNKFFLKNLMILYVSMLLCACETSEVVRDLSQKQALEVVAVLSASGISAVSEKQKGSGAAFSVNVPSSDYQQATVILHQANLPSEDEFNQIIGSSSGFFPSSRVLENLKIDKALSVQLQEHLAALPGVYSVDAVVHSNLPNNSKGVSLILTVNPESGPSERDLRNHLISVIPELSLNGVSLSVIPMSLAEAQKKNEERRGLKLTAEKNISSNVSFLWFATINPRNYWKATALLLSMLLVVMIAGIFIGLWWLSIGKAVFSRQKSTANIALNNSDVRRKSNIADNRDANQGRINK
jgi:type III secretory pathway lipoprotein EscJ